MVRGKAPKLIHLSSVHLGCPDPVVLGCAVQFPSGKFSQDGVGSTGKEAKSNKTKLSEKGFDDAPAVFRKVSQSAAKRMTEFRNGACQQNVAPWAVWIARGAIGADVTINLCRVAFDMRNVGWRNGKPAISAEELRRYLLSLTCLQAQTTICSCGKAAFFVMQTAGTQHSVRAQRRSKPLTWHPKIPRDSVRLREKTGRTHGRLENLGTSVIGKNWIV